MFSVRLPEDFHQLASCCSPMRQHLELLCRLDIFGYFIVLVSVIGFTSVWVIDPVSGVICQICPSPSPFCHETLVQQGHHKNGGKTGGLLDSFANLTVF